MQVQCTVDVVIILFYAVCTCVGVYHRSRSIPLPLYKLKPTVGGSSVHLLLGNAALLLSLSFTLPVVVWIVGLGPRRQMAVSCRWCPLACVAVSVSLSVAVRVSVSVAVSVSVSVSVAASVSVSVAASASASVSVSVSVGVGVSVSESAGA